MTESYEPVEQVYSVDLSEIEGRLRRVGEEWDRHEVELHRLYPEIEAEALRGPVPTPWQIARQ